MGGCYLGKRGFVFYLTILVSSVGVQKVKYLIGNFKKAMSKVPFNWDIVVKKCG